MAAESVGLEICFTGSIRNNRVEVIELLGGNIKPRLPLQSVLHWETFDCASADDGLRTYAAAMIAAGIYKARHVPVPYKPEEMELRLDGALCPARLAGSKNRATLSIRKTRFQPEIVAL